MDRITKTSDGLRGASPLGSMPERTVREISDQGGESYPLKNRRGMMKLKKLKPTIRLSRRDLDGSNWGTPHIIYLINRVNKLEKGIKKHKENCWPTGEVFNDYDEELYKLLKK